MTLFLVYGFCNELILYIMTLNFGENLETKIM